MSTLKVEVVLVDSTERHPNADRLDIAHIKGWQCIIGHNSFVAGRKAVYFPIDSILPPELEAKLFSPDSKIKLNKSRIRTIKIRGAISQGLLIPIGDLWEADRFSIGTDVTNLLGVKKYEPPVHIGSRSNTHVMSPKRTNPYFHKYTDIENFKNYPKLFDDEPNIIAHEKVHGTNFRAGWVPFYPYTMWEKFLKFVGFAPEWKFVYGNHNVQLQDKFWYKGYYGKNVYSEAVAKYHLQTVLKPGEVIYGEIYGDAIQKKYAYGLGAGERLLVVFDAKVGVRYLDSYGLRSFCYLHSLSMPPVVYEGVHPGNEALKTYSEGPSFIDSTQKVREGIVIRPFEEKTCYMGRKILKLKSDTFLLKAEDNTH